MCGITAIFAQNGIVSKENLLKAMRQLDHRGPDNHHYWISSSQKVALGHNRLSIIDLSGGDQPISSENNQIQIVVNGEFYDFEKIRNQLENKGHRFKTKSDSEILIHLYEEYGVKCLEYLRGEFAFILWDENKQLCFVACDRFGIKPIFYSIFDNKIYFASEIKSLFASGIPAKWDIESINIFLSTAIPPFHNKTEYKGIYRIPPGYFLMANQAKIELFKYWDFDYSLQKDIPKNISQETYIEEFREYLSEAVRLRMRADVPVACLLSGGIDSSVILALACFHTNQPIHAFTLGYAEEDHTEEQIAQRTATHHDVVLHKLKLQTSDIADNFVKALWHSETFIFNAEAIAKMMLCKKVKEENFKVVLTGQGSDEILAGYHFTSRDMLFHNRQGQSYIGLLLLIIQLLSNRDVRRFKRINKSIGKTSTISVKKILGFVPTFLDGLSYPGFKMYSLLKDEIKNEIPLSLIYENILSNIDIKGQIVDRDPVNQSLYLWAKTYFPHYILSTIGDRMEMANSIEGRLPFLDHPLVEYLSKVPINMKIKGNKEKFLLKETAKPLITPEVYNRKKQMFFAPNFLIGDDKSNPFYHLIQDTIRSNLLFSQPFFSPKKVIKLLDQFSKMDNRARQSWDTILMTVASFCLLQDIFKIS